MTHPHLVIGLIGYMKSGKDTAALALLEEGFTRVSTADVIRAFLYDLNPLIPTGAGHQRLASLVDTFGWESVKHTYPEARQLLQRGGVAGRTVLHEDVWVDKSIATLPDTAVVVTDVRFPNEAAAIEAVGGIIVRVNRPGTEPGPDAHVSETAMDGYEADYDIENDSTIETLHDVIKVIAAWSAEVADLPCPIDLTTTPSA